MGDSSARAVAVPGVRDPLLLRAPRLGPPGAHHIDGLVGGGAVVPWGSALGFGDARAAAALVSPGLLRALRRRGPGGVAGPRPRARLVDPGGLHRRLPRPVAVRPPDPGHA